MKPTNSTKPARRLLITAALLAGSFALCHVAGLREQTGLLSGTVPVAEADLFLGLLYVASWFAFLLVAPIFALGGGLNLAILAIAARRGRRQAARAVASEKPLRLPAIEIVKP